MPQTDHQQNETNPTGGRDLGQITSLTLSMNSLISIAKLARSTNNKNSTIEDNAKAFVAVLAGHMEVIAGETTAKTFADALGFDHLYKE